MTKMSTLFRRILDGFSILVVLIALGIVVRAYLQGGSPPGREASLVGEPETDEWFYELAGTGHWIGPRDAPVVVLVFSSYNCGFCADFNQSLRALLGRYPQHLAVVFKHFVTPASLAASNVPLGVECAAGQERFPEYHSAVFKYGRLRNYTDGWRALADSAGVPSLTDFEVCVRGQRHAEKIIRDYRAGTRVGVKATPTFFINGRGPVVGAIPIEKLDSMVTMHFRGRAKAEETSTR